MSQRDWKTPGDGLLTYDEVNQREWLDLTVSLLSQFPQPRIESALAEIRPGGLFEGFTWAIHDDVTALAQSAGINLATTDYASNHVAVSELMSLLSVTFQISTAEAAIGFVDPVPVGAQFFLRKNQFTAEYNAAGVSITNIDDSYYYHLGLMLFRTVPEPSTTRTVALGGLVCAGIWRRRRSSRV